MKFPSTVIAKVLLSFFIALSIQACGGSSGGAGSGDASGSTGGGGGDDNLVTYDPQAVHVGSFVDAPVKGLRYETQTQSGYTDEEGHFKYKADERITFYIGDFRLGVVEASKLITPYTLAGSTPSAPNDKVSNIALILQNCDSHTSSEYLDVSGFKEHNFSNAISLDDSADDFVHELQNEGVTVTVDKQSALTHLNNTLSIHGGGGSESGGSGGSDSNETNTTQPSGQHNALEIPQITQEQKKEFLDAVNAARAQQQDCGKYGIKDAVGPLTWSDTLYKAAYTYNYDMVHGNAWHHVGSNTASDIVAKEKRLGHGSHMRDRIEFYNYDFYYIGENIAKGYQTVDEVIQGWIDSDGHCKNLMDPHFTQLGMSLLESDDPNDHYGKYWTQDFGQPKD